MKKGLIVAEKFYSMQGEGQTMGIPAVFLRLAGCNILCKGAGWICDTIEVWKHGTLHPFENVLNEQEVKHLRGGAHLVITGGEPLLQQQAILEYLHIFYAIHAFLPTLEIETNGTILPYKELNDYVSFWNVSPKLSCSGVPLQERYNDIALQYFNRLGLKTIFKFVISKKEDVEEMLNDFLSDISPDKIMLMPAGSSQKELELTRQLVAEEAIKNQLRYCDRLHIVIWNQKTGV